MRKLVGALTVLTIVALASCRDPQAVEPTTKAPASATPERSPAVQVFRVKFDELNHSGVKAEATLQVKGGDLIVTLDAVGHVPHQNHPQHIHGFDAQTSTCPTAANDTDGDGIISFAEGLPAFGPVQVDLEPYPTPTDAAGATHFRQTFIATEVPFAASELTKKTMVLHGDFFGGSYVATLPVACGRVEAVN
jgi:hypothetical protein